MGGVSSLFDTPPFVKSINQDSMKTYNKTTIIFFLLGLATSLFAQSGVAEPKWVRNMPKSPSQSYYYRITYSEGKNYEDAYTKAFAKAIYENACKRGITVDVTMSQNEVESEVANQVSVDQRSMKLFINKACEWWSTSANGHVKIYILWQIGKNGVKDPDFEPYDNCYDY